MDPGEVVYGKNEGKKSRDTVPLKLFLPGEVKVHLADFNVKLRKNFLNIL